jgi:hypothetical protein
MGEAAMLLVSGGTLAALKGSKWATKFGKLVRGLKPVQKLEGGINKARKAGGKAKEILDKAHSRIRAKLRRKAKVFLMPDGKLIGRVPVPKAPTRQVLGQLIEDPIRDLVAKRYGFKLPKKAASATGPDIVVPAGKRVKSGFDIADIKPLNEAGVRKFWDQLDNWRDFGWRGRPKDFKPVKAALFGYDDLGNVYLYGVFKM